MTGVPGFKFVNEGGALMMRPTNSWPRVTGMEDWVSGCGREEGGQEKGPCRYSCRSEPQIPQ